MFGAGSIIYAAKQAKSTAHQTKLLQQQLKSDHERSRRQTAIDLVCLFVQQTRGTAPADLIEPIMDRAVVQSIVNCDPVELSLNERQWNALRVCLKDKDYGPAEANGRITLPRHVVSVVQSAAFEYLNVIEVVLAAWHHHVADREMIEAEFRYLFDTSKGRNCMKMFREIVGGHGIFPAITAFEHTLEEHVKQDLKGKDPIG